MDYGVAAPDIGKSYSSRKSKNWFLMAVRNNIFVSLNIVPNSQSPVPVNHDHVL